MDHAVGGSDVRHRDDGAVHFRTTVKGDGHFGTIDGRGFHAFDQISRHHFARNNVVGQDGDQFVLVFGLEQIFDGAGGKCGESSVGRREYGERTFALQRLNQASLCKGSGQRSEAAVCDGGIDDVHRVAFSEGRHCKGSCGGQRQESSADHWCHSRLIGVPLLAPIT